MKIILIICIVYALVCCANTQADYKNVENNEPEFNSIIENIRYIYNTQDRDKYDINYLENTKNKILIFISKNHTRTYKGCNLTDISVSLQGYKNSLLKLDNCKSLNCEKYDMEFKKEIVSRHLSLLRNSIQSCIEEVSKYESKIDK